MCRIYNHPGKKGLGKTMFAIKFFFASVKNTEFYRPEFSFNRTRIGKNTMTFFSHNTTYLKLCMWFPQTISWSSMSIYRKNIFEKVLKIVENVFYLFTKNASYNYWAKVLYISNILNISKVLLFDMFSFKISMFFTNCFSKFVKNANQNFTDQHFHLI